MSLGIFEQLAWLNKKVKQLCCIVENGGGGGSALTIKDDGTTLTTAATSIDFTGDGVTATNTGSAVTINIPGPSYAVYTALLTQTGGDVGQVIDTGTLIVGVTYYINNDSPGMDFTNVGAPNNTIGTSFVATGTTPTSWGSLEGTSNATLSYNDGAPVVTVLENTIGNIWFTYASQGFYVINSNNLFTNDKTWLGNQVILLGTGGSTDRGTLSYNSSNELYILTEADIDVPLDTLLINRSIEIRVYP